MTNNSEAEAAAVSTDDQLRNVVHDYKDHANEMDPGLLELSEGKPAHATDRNFPVKLHYMLSELEGDGQDHIVSWAPHGRCFVVHDQEEFVRSILPMWFRQSKFASFQRQLNLYGFKRITTGRDKKGYYHELFLRSRRYLSHRIPRIKLKGTGSRKPTSPETEPNFYLLPYLPAEKKDGKNNFAPSTASSEALAGAVTGLNGFGKNFDGGSSSLDKLMQASTLPGLTLNGGGMGGFGLNHLSNLSNFNTDNTLLDAYGLGLPVPGLLGGVAGMRGSNAAAFLQAGLLSQSNPMASQLFPFNDMAMRIALLQRQQQISTGSVGITNNTMNHYHNSGMNSNKSDTGPSVV